jgi:hypothetical protein
MNRILPPKLQSLMRFRPRNHGRAGAHKWDFVAWEPLEITAFDICAFRLLKKHLLLFLHWTTAWSPDQRKTSTESTKLILQPTRNNYSEVKSVLKFRQERLSTLKFECDKCSRFKKRRGGFNQFRDTRSIFISNCVRRNLCLSIGSISIFNLEYKIQFEIAIEFILCLSKLHPSFRENS